MTPNLCAQCRTEMPAPAKTGRQRRYCSPACRTEAYRDRMADAVIWDAIDVEVDPVDEATLQALTIEAAAADLKQAPAAPPEERLVRAVIETRVLAGQFRALGRQVKSGLGLRAESMSDDLTQAIAKNFGEEASQ